MRKALVATLVLPCAVVAAARSARADGEQSTLEPYGFVRLDTIYDDSRMSHPHFPMWVEDEDVVERDDQELAIHPRLTRIGAKISPPQPTADTKIDGKIEIDFQNGGKESRALIRMRHAYLRVAHGQVELLAGQTWDLISPLYPAANNDGMMWNAGNTGDRRPQLRASFLPAVGGGTLRLAIAAGMPNAVNAQDLDGNGQLDGFDAAIPVLQGLAELTLPRVQLGGWAHFSRDRVTIMETETYDALLVGGHLRVPFGDRVWVQGEAFYGQNATDVRAGIGQGINAAGDEIRTLGGWAEAGVQVSDQYRVSAGATLDAPRTGDLDDGARKRNLAVFVVQHIHPWKQLQIGAEYLYWRTDYVGGGNGTANRVDLHVTMPF